MEREKMMSLDVGRAALRIAVTSSRGEENIVKQELADQQTKEAAVDFGGEFTGIIVKIVERAVVAAQRQGIVPDNHIGAGPVAGAAAAALEQVKLKALGFNVGGKIGIARHKEHLCVAIYMGVGMLNLNELCVGLAHRSIKEE